MIIILRVGALTDIEPIVAPSSWGEEWREIFLLELVPIMENRLTLQRALRDPPPEGGWVVFTSANAVRFALAFMEVDPNPPSEANPFNPWRVAAIGGQTAEELGRHGISVDLIPPQAEGRSLAAAVRSRGARRVLWPANISHRQDMLRELDAGGIPVEEIPVYGEERSGSAEEELSRLLATGQIRALGFTTENTVRAFQGYLEGTGRSLEPEFSRILFGAIGPTTARALERAGVAHVVVPRVASVRELISELQSALRSGSQDPACSERQPNNSPP